MDLSKQWLAAMTPSYFWGREKSPNHESPKVKNSNDESQDIKIAAAMLVSWKRVPVLCNSTDMGSNHAAA